jgi:hypothetical protein
MMNTRTPRPFAQLSIWRRLPRYFGAILTFGLSIPSAAHASLSQPVSVDKTWLANENIASAGTVISAQRIRDKHGDHILVLSRRAGPSPSNPNTNRIEHIELDAVFYRRAGARWQAEWTIHDLVDCPHLDSSADFFPDSVTFTDLNDDGRVEVTVPYHLFCGGGIDTHTVKVILREGAAKLAIRGDSRMFYPGQAPFGGEHQYDKALLQPDRAAYKKHLDAVWQAVSVFRYR